MVGKFQRRHSLDVFVVKVAAPSAGSTGSGEIRRFGN
ncbi:MAG: hypothetical protein JWN91_3733 [Nocardioides sp.]|jgi:hypothetical protein|nr:hypothetical protein [Nocardioides sp.]